MIRKATISLKNANKGKLEKLEIITKEYVRVVNLFIDIFWEQKQFMFKFAPQSDIDSWLSARIKQATAKQALSIIKSQRKRKKKYKPMLTRFAMELDSRFIEIGQDINSFDFWIKLSSIGDKIILNIPSRKHRQFNKLAKEGWKIKNSLRVRLNENGYFAFEKHEIALATPEEKTFFHELAHAGHERIKGKLTPGQDPFQEIIAELCAQALCRLIGKSGEKYFGNSARYISRYAEKAGISPHTVCLKVLADTEKVLKLIVGGIAKGIDQ